MVNWDGLNRRRFPRVRYPCLIVIRSEEQDNNVILTHTENIGVGGVCIVLKEPLKMFSNITIELDLLDMESHIKCEGKIMWCVQRSGSADKKPLFYDMGIEYVGLDEKELKRLDSIVVRLVKQNREVPYNEK
ncbi:MAG: PilZ domain-containing protein [Candidatus Zapsychrus exili]|nr:PilZ domain-containing protein [Candidatus Zapsychrus exili]